MWSCEVVKLGMTRPDKKEGVASVKVRDVLTFGSACRHWSTRRPISQQGIAEPEPERPRPQTRTSGDVDARQRENGRGLRQ